MGKLARGVAHQVFVDTVGKVRCAFVKNVIQTIQLVGLNAVGE